MKPAESRALAEIVRLWKQGDAIELALPMPVQRVYASDKIISGDNRPSPTKDRVALRMGPLVYNIEQVDQDISSVLPASAPLAAEWRADLLNGVNVIKGTLAGGAPMLAVPNFARYNRNPPGAQPGGPLVPTPPPAPGATPPPRPAPPPATSIVRDQGEVARPGLQPSDLRLRPSTRSGRGERSRTAEGPARLVASR